MSKPRYGWWSYAKYMVREYPKRKAEYQDLKRIHPAQEISRIAGKVPGGRTTENVALRQLPPAKQAEYDAVSKAIEQTEHLITGPERLAVIDMVFWKQSHTLDGAAYAAGISYDTAVGYHRDFVRLVGFNRGLEDY